jgi:hypothetical protein
VPVAVISQIEQAGQHFHAANLVQTAGRWQSEGSQRARSARSAPLVPGLDFTASDRKSLGSSAWTPHVRLNIYIVCLPGRGEILPVVVGIHGHRNNQSDFPHGEGQSSAEPFETRPVFNCVRQHFKGRGYWVSTLGYNKAAVWLYIQEQEKADQRRDKLGLFGGENRFAPFTVYKPPALPEVGNLLPTALPLKFILKLSYYSPGFGLFVQPNWHHSTKGKPVRKEVLEAGSDSRVIGITPIAVDFGKQVKFAPVNRY